MTTFWRIIVATLWLSALGAVTSWLMIFTWLTFFSAVSCTIIAVMGTWMGRLTVKLDRQLDYWQEWRDRHDGGSDG